MQQLHVAGCTTLPAAPKLCFRHTQTCSAGFIALAVWMIPPHVMDSARARAASAPIKLDQSLAGLSAIFVLWDVGVLSSIDWAMKYLLPKWWKGASLVVLCSITIGLAGAQIIWWLGVSKQHQEKSA